LNFFTLFQSWFDSPPIHAQNLSTPADDPFSPCKPIGADA